MYISVSDGREGGHRPVHRCNISTPQARLQEIAHGGSNPCLARVGVPRRQEIEEAAGAVDGKDSDL